MHKLLRRQLKRHLGTDDLESLPEQWRAFAAAAGAAYEQFDADRILLERSLELTSRELLGRNEELRLSNARELLARNAELQRSNADLEQFAYVASHDLQEPLRVITSYIQLLERRYGTAFDESGKRYLGYVVDGSKRMRSLIEDLLAYSRVGQGKLEITEVDCNVLLADVRRNLQIAIRESGATITADELPHLRANRGQLVQLFENLIGNGIKYRGDAPPEIHVSATREGGEVRFCVRDNGIGIDPKYGERIFQIFQRLHGREKYTGTGIGLAIAKKIVERHGGHIWVESAVGEGARFFFTVPAVTTPSEPPSQG